MKTSFHWPFLCSYFRISTRASMLTLQARYIHSTCIQNTSCKQLPNDVDKWIAKIGLLPLCYWYGWHLLDRSFFLSFECITIVMRLQIDNWKETYSILLLSEMVFLSYQMEIVYHDKTIWQYVLLVVPRILVVPLGNYGTH